MRLCVAVIIVMGLNSASFAEALSPWFGSEASAPEQFNFSNNESQIVDSAQISSADVEIICPIEACPTDAKFVKQPE